MENSCDSRKVNWLKERSLFVRNYLDAPNTIGSVTPSSRFLTRAMLNAADVDSRHVIAELGPGTGAITSEIVRRMADDARLFVFEVNTAFVTQLHQRFSDPRVAIFHESADKLGQRLAEQKLDHVDCVVSSLPFAALPDSVAASILQTVRDALAPQGVFVGYQYTFMRLNLLRSYFPTIRIAHLVIRNLPPALVLVCNL